MDGYLAVRKLPADHVELDRVGIGHADRHVDQHPPAALPNLLEQREARVPDRVRHRATGRLGRITSVHVDPHPELQHTRLCAHDVASFSDLTRRIGSMCRSPEQCAENPPRSRRYSLVPIRVASTNCSVESSMARLVRPRACRTYSSRGSIFSCAGGGSFISYA